MRQILNLFEKTILEAKELEYSGEHCQAFNKLNKYEGLIQNGNPFFSSFYNVSGDISCSLGNYEKASKDYNKALESSRLSLTDKIHAELRKGFIHGVKDSNFAKAHKEIDSVLSKDASLTYFKAQGYFLKGLLFYEQGTINKILKSFQSYLFLSATESFDASNDITEKMLQRTLNNIDTKLLNKQSTQAMEKVRRLLYPSKFGRYTFSTDRSTVIALPQDTTLNSFKLIYGSKK